MRILIVEDEPSLSDSIATYLTASGFVCAQSHRYVHALDKLAVHTYDLAVLDIRLPDGSGLDILSEIKTSSPETGVLMLTAMDDLQDKLQGLQRGADDYLTKPFHLPELQARLQAIYRRRKQQGNMQLVFEEITLNTESRTANVQGTELDLTRKEFDLLLFLISNRDRVITKTAIAEHVWGDHMEEADQLDFVYTHIKNIRKKLEQAGIPDYLKTVYGLGYKITAG